VLPLRGAWAGGQTGGRQRRLGGAVAEDAMAFALTKSGSRS
jgi:hypothetical protein